MRARSQGGGEKNIWQELSVRTAFKLFPLRLTWYCLGEPLGPGPAPWDMVSSQGLAAAAAHKGVTPWASGCWSALASSKVRNTSPGKTTALPMSSLEREFPSEMKLGLSINHLGSSRHATPGPLFTGFSSSSSYRQLNVPKNIHYAGKYRYAIEYCNYWLFVLVLLWKTLSRRYRVTLPIPGGNM